MVQGRPAYIVAFTPRVKGSNPGPVPHMCQTVGIGLGIKRLHADTFQRLPDETVGIASLQFLRRALTPGVRGIALDPGIFRHRVIPFFLSLVGKDVASPSGIHEIGAAVGTVRTASEVRAAALVPEGAHGQRGW